MSKPLEVDLKDLDLPQERLGLHDLQTRFPHLATGPESPVYVVADLPPPARVWLLGATWPARLLALALDMGPLLLLELLVLRGMAEFSYLHPEVFGGGHGPTLVRLGSWSGALVAYLIYFTLWERLMGWTPGKMVVGIRVVDDFGHRPRLGATLLRSLLRLVDLALLASLALAPLGLAKEPRRRRGDRLSRTWVVDA